MTVVENLEAAWALIAEPERRCTGYYAKDSAGDDCEALAPDAVRWCSYGALERVLGYAPSVTCRAYVFLRFAAKELGHDLIGFAHDADPIANPPRIYARAIELALAEEVGGG